MAFLRTLVRSVAFVGLGAAWLQAQTTHARVLVAPQGQPRIAAIAPPPSPPRPSSFEETVFVSNDVFVLPDGRVFIDLGNSYEQVARICSYAYGYGCRRYSIYARTLIFPSYGEPTYAPPVYGAEAYPIFAYPPGGYISYAPAPYYVGCPPGYVSPGSYPPCIDPYYAPVRSPAVPTPRALHSAPPRATATTLRAVRK